MYSSTLTVTSALDGGGWLTLRPSLFSPGIETWYPRYRRLGEPHGQAGRLWKISPSPGLDPRTVQPVASRYSDWAIPVPDRQRSITLKLVRETTVAVQKQEVLHTYSECVSTACKAHTPYYFVICGLSSSTVFFDIISYMARSSEQKKCVFWFSL